METQVIKPSTDDIRLKAELDKRTTEAFKDGLLSSGENINGYKIVSRMDSDSGEGEIYKCQNANGETFVMKYYFTKKPDAENQRILANYHHPDILVLADYGEYNGHAYEVMEFAAGGSLADKLPNGKYRYLPVDYKTCDQIVSETVNAFNTFHADGIIHRDIKPENLLYKNADGSDIVVGDFGISSAVLEGETKHLTQTTSSGTVGYIAPEVSSGVIGKEIDYYALGITVWVLLTGLEPFTDEKGNVMFPGQILLDGLQGKTVEKLLGRSPQLDERYKNLIRGLLTVRHEKRWGYDEVQKFLNGENPVVFEEKRDLPPFEFNGKNYYSLNEISDAFLNDRKSAAETIYSFKLERYLRKIDDSGKLFNLISNLTDEYSSNGKEDEGVVRIAFSLCPGREFYLGEWGNSESVSSVKDIIDVLRSNPMLILKHFKNFEGDFYIYLDSAGLEEIGKQIKEISKDCADDFMLKNRICVALDGNRIKPFCDGVNDNVELVQLEHLNKLPDYLKERVMMLIYQKNGFVSAWIENISEYRIAKFIDIVEQFSGISIENWGTFETLQDYLSGQNITAIAMKKLCGEQGDILDLAQTLRSQNKIEIMNILIDNSWEQFYKNGEYEKTVKLLANIQEGRTEKLTHDFGYFSGIRGMCCEKMNDTEKARGCYAAAVRFYEANGKGEAWVYRASGDLEFSKGNVAKSLELYESAIKFAPNDEWLWFRKGNVLLYNGRPNSAAACYETALSFGKHKAIYIKLASAYKKMTPPLKDKAEQARSDALDCAD